MTYATIQYTVLLKTAVEQLIMERPGFSSTSDGRVLLFGPNSCFGEYKRVSNRRQVKSDDNMISIKRC
jgi:hypothetical protein